MPSHLSARSGCRLLARMVAPLTLLLLCPGTAAGEVLPTLQDMQLVARIIGFQNKPVSRPASLCVVSDPGGKTSGRVARRVEALLQNGLSAGGIELGIVSIPQDALGSIGGIDAIFTTPGVDPLLLRAALIRLHVPCFTVDQTQLGSGGCMVAVQTDPKVSIILDQDNAEAANVHFATAFRMMVTEQ